MTEILIIWDRCDDEQRRKIAEQLAPLIRETKRKPRTSKGTRLLPDWRPSSELRAWARQKRPDLDLDELTEEFRDYWMAVPGQRGCKLDWDATFRNRVRSKYQPKGQVNGARTLEQRARDAGVSARGGESMSDFISRVQAAERHR